LTHWLARLTRGSSLSRTSHPENPANVTFNASLLNGADPQLGAYVTAGNWQKTITASAIEDDFWSLGIYKVFEELASKDRMYAVRLGLDGNAAGSSEVLEALTRINKGTNYKLRLSMHGADEQAAAAAIAADIAATDAKSGMHYMALASQTLWDVLIGYLRPHYMFSIIPLPEIALAVPYIPGLKDPWLPQYRNETAPPTHTIRAKDYHLIDTPGVLSRPLRAICIFGATGFLTGANLDAATDEDAAIAGTYPPIAEIKNRPGTIIFKRAPSWLSNLVAPWRYSSQTSGISNVVSDACSPGEGPEADIARSSDLIAQAATLLDRNAHALFANQVLGTRSGQLVGAVRLDICPGSTISIQGIPEPWLTRRNVTSPVSSTRYATVLRVELFFDTSNENQPQAHTAFTLGHVRTQQETDADKTLTLEGHPLYVDDNNNPAKFPGDYLVKDAYI